VAQAQHAIKEMTDILVERGIEVKFGIHPVAGRMPGHMNVLLAEAEVPYEQLYDMDEINPEFPQTDVVIVLGANDVVNPIARSEEGGALKGMPILDIDKARQTVIIKRSLSPGFAGVDNPQFYAENNAMLFGDGKKMVNSVIAALKNE
jgi:NAD(P) transhydrogenase subunit beta